MAKAIIYSIIASVLMPGLRTELFMILPEIIEGCISVQYITLVDR